MSHSIMPHIGTEVRRMIDEGRREIQQRPDRYVKAQQSHDYVKHHADGGRTYGHTETIVEIYERYHQDE